MKKINPFIYLIIFMFSFPAWSQGENSEIETDIDEVKERKYVTDKLRLSLYKNADSNSGTLKLLISGDVLDVLERSGPYSKVVTDNGLTGWVKNGFLLSVPTASFLLIEEKKKNLQLSEQLDKYSDTQKIVSDYENTILKMNSDNELSQQEKNKIKQELEHLYEENRGLKEEIEAYSQNNDHLSLKDLIGIVWQYWHAISAILLFIFLIGFILGKEIIQARLRKRFQGVKVL